ncbi:unnamed protein product, partial [Didymodactylos carnosus]
FEDEDFNDIISNTIDDTQYYRQVEHNLNKNSIQQFVQQEIIYESRKVYRYKCSDNDSSLFAAIKFIEQKGALNLTPLLEYRKRAARTIENNAQYRNSCKNPMQYIIDLQQEGTYGSGIELHAFADLYQIQYYVLCLNDNNKILRTCVCGNDVQCAYLLFDEKRNHYDPLFFGKLDGTIDTIVQRDDKHINNIIQMYIQETNDYTESVQTSEPLNRWDDQYSRILDYEQNNVN